MSANRAEKSGFAREAQGKVMAKWDSELAVEAMNWVSSSIQMPLPDGYCGDVKQTYEYLKSGFVLGKMANFCVPGSVRANLLNKPQTMAFKQMELIGLFLSTLKTNKIVKEMELFQTVDLYEETNMPMVIFTISSLGRAMQKDSRGFGKAESIGEKKEWTEEQLKAGQNIIGLQMGTNKGASQAGLNIGKTRAIMD